MPVAVGVLLVLLGVLAVALLLVVRASAECRLCFNGTKGEAKLCLRLLFGLLPVGAGALAVAEGELPGKIVKVRKAHLLRYPGNGRASGG